MGYDALDRLSFASTTGRSIGYTYDANGNRLTQTGTTAATYTTASTHNRVTSISGTPARTYAYDAAGNVTGYGGMTFTYADSGRLSSVTNAGVATSYLVNALGQRVKKSNSATTVYFVYDEAGHLIGEYSGTGALIEETVWMGDIPVATLRPNGSGVDLFYVHTDHLNTPRRISRPSDNVVVWRWDSDPFGTNAANEDPDGDSMLFTYNLRFPGQYSDSENGLNQNMARDYDPPSGRYVQSDPIGLAGGLNSYAYVDSNPISLADPNGLQAVLPWVEPIIRPLPLPTIIDPALIVPDVIINPSTGQPDWNQTRACRDMAKKIENLRKDIEKRTEDLRTNPQNLPERVPLGPSYRMRHDQRGHRQLLDRQWNELRKREKEYDEKCKQMC